MLRRSTLIRAAAAAAISWTTAPAVAQEAAEPSPAPAPERTEAAPVPGVGIEEIVVTARRKSESQQDVPVSVSALTGDELSFNSVEDVADIGKSIPGIQIRPFGARTSTASFTMRGQSAGSDVATVDGAVGVYINDVYAAREKGLNQSLYDIDNVQVLRGPQGTLFGRNTTGGALLINTRMPEEDFGGYLKLVTGDYSRYGAEGAINLPVSETFGARLAFNVLRRNGYAPRCVRFSPAATIDGDCDQGGERQDLDDENVNAWRLSLSWDPTEYFSTTLVHDGSIANTNGTASFLTNVVVADPSAYPSVTAPLLIPFLPTLGAINPRLGTIGGATGAACTGAFAPGAPLTAITGVLTAATPANGLGDCLTQGFLSDQERATDDRIEDRWTASEQKQRGKVTTYGLSSTSTVDLEAATAKFILGFRHVEVLEDFDLDGTGVNVLWTEQDYDQDQFSAELLMDGSAWNERVDWTTGLYFFEENGNDGSFSPILFFAPPFTHFDADYNHRSYSGYVNTVFHLTETINLLAGYRYTIDQREMEARHDSFQTVTPALGPESPRTRVGCVLFQDVSGTIPFPPDGCFKDVKKEFDAHTGQVGFQWQPTDTFQTYVTWRRGYRSGGFNLRAQSPEQFEPFEPEYVDDFEIGAKADFMLGDMPVRTNVALYYDLYDNAQRSVIKVTSTGSLQTVILNAAEATIKGWEIEVRANPIESLELRFGSAAAIARYDEYEEDIDTNPAQPGIQPFDRSDQHFGQPDFTTNVSGRYTLPIEQLFGRPSGTMAVQLDWNWSDWTLLSGPQGPGFGDNRQDPYHLVDMRFDWSNVLDSPFDFSFWIRNLADKRVALGAVNFQNSFGFDVLNYGPVRLYGAELTYRF